MERYLNAKNIKKIYKAHPFLIGLGSAVLTFFAGFFVMLLMYRYWQQTSRSFYPDLKGLFDYKAALIGDSVCLPLIIGAGITYIILFYDFVKDKIQRMIPWVVAALSGIAGIMTQASWIRSDSTVPNWSIPEVHHFNYAGWYHAVFFVVICIAVAYIFTCFVQIDYTIGKRNTIDWGWKSDQKAAYYACQFIVWTMGILFLQLHYLDDLTAFYHPVLIISVIALVALGILLLEKEITYRGNVQIKYKRPVLYAVLIATLCALAVIAFQRHPQCDMTLLVAGILCTSLYVYNSENKLKMIILFMIFALLNCCLQLGIAIKLMEADIKVDILVAVFLFFMCLLVPCIISWEDYRRNERKNPYDNSSHLKSLLYVTVIEFGLIALSDLNLVSRLLDSDHILFNSQILINIVTLFSDDIQYDFGSFLITGMVVCYIRVTFEKIKIMEYDIGRNYSSKELEQAKISQYILYVLAYAAALLLLWKMLVFKFNIVFSEIEIVVLLGIVVLAAGLYYFVFRVMESLTLLKFFFFFVVVLMACIVYITNQSFDIKGFWDQCINLPWWDYAFIIVISCSLSVFLTISIIFNTSLIRQKKLDMVVAKSAVVLGILCGLCYGVVACFLFVSHSLFHVLSLFVITLITMCIIPYLQVWSINPDGNRGLLDNYARSGVAQDGFLYGIVATANTIITVTISSDIPQMLKGSLVSMKHLGFIFFTFAIGIFVLWNYCMQNNNEHLKKKGEEYEKIDKDGMSHEDKTLINTQFENLSLYLKCY